MLLKCGMSRLIVKGLPMSCTTERLKRHFKQFEPITDVSLKYTPEGVFRKFAFVGFASEEAANGALKEFNKTFLDTSRITTELCLPISEKDKIRPWSKHTKGSSAYKRFHGDESVLTNASARKTVISVPEIKQSKYANDPNFAEFLKVRGVKIIKQEDKQEVTEDSTHLLMVSIEEFNGEKHLTLILRGLPPNLKQTNLKEWLSPIRIKSCYLVRNTIETFAFVTFNRPGDLRKALQRTDQFLGGYKVRICKFPVNDEKSTLKMIKTNNNSAENENFNLEAEKKRLHDEILDTGRLFVRNLPYMCTEKDLMFHFKSFGEIVDCQCVVDRRSGKCKGFAVITYMFPENALEAYKQLDGTIYQGRMLHLLPGKEKPDNDTKMPEAQYGMSAFQKQRAAEQKKNATKAAYSWNTLFMGANAVAETLAEKLGVSKSDFLEGDNETSAGVRMSLAETRLVRETRDFLTRNGVSLDSFARPPTQRSETVIIAKNLPADIKEEELREKFEKFGKLKRFLLPPECKVTGLIEMQNRVDAKIAFTALCYSRIRNQPLYLEWAPNDVFEENATTIETMEKSSESTTKTHQNTQENCSVQPEAEKDEEKTKLSPSTKILVRNIPFQSSVKEIRALFSAFGEIKSVRLPKKPGGQESHRGFGFVEFESKTDAATAFDALVHSTHLYGRRLVLEWSADTETTEELRYRTRRRMSKRAAIDTDDKTLSKKELRKTIEANSTLGSDDDDEVNANKDV